MQHDFILLDRSGSMDSMWGEALSAINSYVSKLAADNVDTGVTLAAFDTGHDGNLSFEILRDRIIPSTWKKVTSEDASPRGSTPLNDATGKIVALAKAGNYDKVSIIIMTDGHENSSRELSVSQAKALLDDCRSKNWQVTFLGANFDNASQGASYGNMATHTHSIAKGNLGAATQTMATARARYAATGASMGLSAEEKARLAGH